MNIPQTLPPSQTAQFPAVIFLVGATATGKTQLALELAQHIPLEIISIDSALIYRDMNIGTAKPNAHEQARVPHHLLDICSPMDTFSAAAFCDAAQQKIQEINARNKLPLFVGGTMMYVKALCDGLSDVPPSDPDIRLKIQSLAEQHGWKYLHDQLKIIDPESAARLSENDKQRISRALEIYEMTGKKWSQLLQSKTHPPLKHPYLMLKMSMTRALLHKKIAQRFHTMLDHGFLQEMQALRRKYPNLHEDLPSMRCIGYRQAWQFLEGKIDKNQWLEQSIAATRQLAKRQETWLRSLPNAIEIDALLPLDAQTHTAHTHIVHFLSALNHNVHE